MVYESNKFHMLACEMEVCAIVIVCCRYHRVQQPNDCDTKLVTLHQHLSYSVVCLTTGPKPLPKRFLHIVRSKASSFKWEYPLVSLRSSSSFLRLLPRLLVTSISPFIFPSITWFRRQFLRTSTFRKIKNVTYESINYLIVWQRGVP